MRVKYILGTFGMIGLLGCMTVDGEGQAVTTSEQDQGLLPVCDDPSDDVCPTTPTDNDGDGVSADLDCDDANPKVGALLYQDDFSADTGWFQPTEELPDPWSWSGTSTYAGEGGQQVQLGQAQSWSNVMVYARLRSLGTESMCGLEDGQEPCGEDERWRAGIVVRGALDSDQDEGYHGYRCALASNATNGCFEDGLFLQLAEFMDAPEDDIASECNSDCPENTTFDQLARQNHDSIDLAGGDEVSMRFYAVGSELLCVVSNTREDVVSVSAADSSFTSGTIGLSTLNMYGEFDHIRVCEAFALPEY